jgi:RNA polymerase sigma-70 factor (ECF subfamily)
VTQEVFLKVFRNIRGFHGEASLRTWLYRIALREASNQRRWWFRHKHQEIALDAPACRCTTCDSAPDEQTLISTLTADGSSPFDQTAQHELRARVEAALHQLPSSYRAVVVLREIEGFSYDEIADLLKINLGTVKSRLMRGRAALRSLLAPSFGIASRSSASADCCAASTEVKPLHKQPGSPSLRSGLEVSQ